MVLHGKVGLDHAKPLSEFCKTVGLGQNENSAILLCCALSAGNGYPATSKIFKAGRRLRARFANSMPFMLGIMASENKTAVSARFWENL